MKMTEVHGYCKDSLAFAHSHPLNYPELSWGVSSSILLQYSSVGLESVFKFTIKILSFQTDRSGQNSADPVQTAPREQGVQTASRKQSDQCCTVCNALCIFWAHY